MTEKEMDEEGGVSEFTPRIKMRNSPNQASRDLPIGLTLTTALTLTLTLITALTLTLTLTLTLGWQSGPSHGLDPGPSPDSRVPPSRASSRSNRQSRLLRS